MRMLRSIAIALGLAVTVSVAGAAVNPAVAGPDRGWKQAYHDHHKKHHKKHKKDKHHRDHKYHGHKGDRVVFTREVRVVIEEYYRGGRHCPPGLRKKKNGCLPPGHAKKRYHVGKELPRHVRVERLPRYLRHRLPPPPAGYRYGYVDNDVLLIADATHRVVDAVVAVNAAMNALR